jgi:hypothetical protein
MGKMLNTKLLSNRWVLTALALGMALLAPLMVVLVLSGFMLGLLAVGTMILFVPVYLVLSTI